MNLVISNVPGPRQPLYFAGAKMVHQFPVSIVTDGQGLNITIHSYLDRLDFGFIVDRELVPDVWDLADMHIDEIARLFERREPSGHRPHPPSPAAGRSGWPRPRRRRIGHHEVPPLTGSPAVCQAWGVTRYFSPWPACVTGRGFGGQRLDERDLPCVGTGERGGDLGSQR